MRKTLAKTLFLCLVVTGLVGSLFAAVPHLISYQGKLTNSNGQPLDGTYKFDFNIYNVSTGGTPLWTETQNTIQVTGGLYSVLLGTVTALNLPFDVPYWLEIVVNGEPLKPLQPLTSSPYVIAEGTRSINTSDIADGSITPAKVSTGSYQQIWAGTATIATSLTAGTTVTLGTVNADNYAPVNAAWLVFTTSTYTMGYSSATKFYGDGSELTNIGGGSVIDLNVRISTGLIQTQLVTVGQSTGTLASQVGISTGTLQSNINDLFTSTGTLQNQFVSVGQSTGTLRTDLDALSGATVSTIVIVTDATTLDSTLIDPTIKAGYMLFYINALDSTRTKRLYIAKEDVQGTTSWVYRTTFVQN